MPARSDSIEAYGSSVKAARQARGLNQRELAKQLAIAPLVLGKIERGELRPATDLAQRIVELLQTQAPAESAPAEDVGVQTRAPPSVNLTRVTGGPALGEPETSSDEPRLRAQLSKRGYRIIERIGEGGFGSVYRAEQTSVGRDVAIKVIRPELANDTDFIRRFELEARLVARLEHPHIVPLYDYWREPGAAFMVMRYLRGGSVADRLSDPDGKPLRLLALIGQIGQALHAAHQAGIVHRDLKPANVLLDSRGNACLADFGIAKLLDNDSGATRMGEFMGSVAYAAPEQLRGEAVSPASDIYALGVMCFELVSGRRPFAAATPAGLIQQHLNCEPPDAREFVPELPAALADAIAAALQKLPERRPSDAHSFVAMIDTAVRAAMHSGWNGKVAYGQSLTLGQELAPTPTALLQISDTDNPYRGLSAFSEADERNFFGREALVDQLLLMLGEQSSYARALFVVGSSGSGKSSVVRAGLIPALRLGGVRGSRRWLIADCMPGRDPQRSLAQALARVSVRADVDPEALISGDAYGLTRAIDRCLPNEPGCELLLLVDQFEELFTLCDDEAARNAFIASITTALLDPHSRLRMIFTLRADFLDRPLQYADLGELLRERTALVPAMSPDEIERAIVGPARRLGVQFQDGLVAALLADSSRQAGALPLLQYALTELFARREENTLTLKAFQAFGGIRGALAGRADASYAGLDEAGRRAAQQLFLRLTTLGEGSEDTRRRVSLSEIEAVAADDNAGHLAAQAAAIEVFSKARLLTFDRDPSSGERTVELAHEALLRSWSQLRDWLSMARSDLRLQRQLAQAATAWRENRFDHSFLLTGNRLAQIQPLAKGELVALSREEETFLQASLQADDDERRASSERAARELAQARQLAEEQQRAAEVQRRGNVRLRWLVAGLGLVLAFASWQGFQLQRRGTALAEETRRANQEATSANALSDFWSELFATADPNQSRGRGRELTVVEVLDGGLATVDARLAAAPRARAKLLLTMGRSFRQLGAFDNAQTALDKAVVVTGDDAPVAERIELLLERGRLLADRARPDEALVELEQAQKLQDSSGAAPLVRATTLNIIASIYNDQTKLASAEPLLRETLKLRRAHGASDSEIAASLNNLAFTLLTLGQAREARDLFREGAELRERMQSELSLDATLMRMNMAVASRDLGDFAAANDEFAQVRTRLLQLVGGDGAAPPQHPTLAGLLLHESSNALLQNELPLALEKIEASLAMTVSLNGGQVDAPATLPQRRDRGRTLLLMGRLDEAEPDIVFACAQIRQRFGEASSANGACTLLSAELAAARGDSQAALEQAGASIDIFSARPDRELRSGIDLARALLLRHRLATPPAAADLERALALLKRAEDLVRARQLLERVSG